jgi:hypothetical protein
MDIPYKPRPTAPTIEANPQKWSAAFLDRRMREHREWQDRITADLASDIVSEVAAALEEVRRMRPKPSQLRLTQQEEIF